MNTLISLDALVHGPHHGLDIARYDMLQKLANPASSLFPDSLTVIIDEPYKGAGFPLKMSHAFSGYPCHENKKLDTWKLMSQVFKHLQAGKCYHFLCFRERSDKKNNYYPLALIEEIALSQAKSLGAKLHHLAVADPLEYLETCSQRNKAWLEMIE